MKIEICLAAAALAAVSIGAFKPDDSNKSAVGECLKCHAVPQGPRRAASLEFGMASHHLQSAKINEKDCRACHDLSQHTQGQVRLRNADTGERIILSGDPMTDYAQALLLEPMCLACHDEDGAGGKAPFSDGIMPPVIDADLFNLGSHKPGGSAGPMTCFGDGETFGCHNTGHGSAKIKMLAPYTADQPPVDGDPLREEEGMCYTCHDADGPSSFDMQAFFDMATHHNISSLDQIDGSKVECINCHNPHTTNSTTLLADPDSGGKDPWLGDKVDFCITCHDGGPPVDVAFPANWTGTGYNKADFIGTTHEVNLGGEGCGHCHNGHGAANKSLLYEEYVTEDFNRYTRGDGDYASCWKCHDEVLTVNGRNAFGTEHDLHVVDEDAACITCHDVHAPLDPGEPGLINFDFGVFGGFDMSYRTDHEGSGAFVLNGGMTAGSCYINCHGRSHTPKNYARDENPVTDCSDCH